MTEKDLTKIHENMLYIFEKNDIKIDKIYYCPHDYEKIECDCRKPKTGMALQAKKDFPDIDFVKSLMIGDSLSDMEFARNMNMKFVLVNNKELSETEDLPYFESLYVFANTIYNIKADN